MLQQANQTDLDLFFVPLANRLGQNVFFCRIDGYSPAVAAFLRQYWKAARQSGVVIENRIPNPDNNQLAFLAEMLGTDFQMNQNFLSARLKKWLPRLSGRQNGAVAAVLFDLLQDMLRHGKSENILRNTYIKFMCWLYYKFERVVSSVGGEQPPKILYDGELSQYELQMLVLLSRVGADIVLLERNGDRHYQSLDPQSAFSFLYQAPGLSTFPADFSIAALQAESNRELRRQRLYGPPPSRLPCTNAWMQQPSWKEILTAPAARGTDDRFFCNVFIAQSGVEDPLTFSDELYTFHQSLRNQQRRVCIVNGGIPVPGNEEITAVHRGQYADLTQLAADLSRNIRFPGSADLERLMRRAFLDIILQEDTGVSLQKKVNQSVYLLCWLKRYQNTLFARWKLFEIAVFILFGRCTSHYEALFLRLLARLPVDVLLLMPDAAASCPVSDPSLLTIHFDASVSMDVFPAEPSQRRVRTAAYQAERELDSLLYQESGLYRNQQYAKADAVTLQPMTEEIPILWDQEVKYRPGFAADGDKVTIPVFCEKLCGVKNGQTDQYWLEIKKLITPDTLVVRSVPWLSSLDENPLKPFATSFLQHGRLLKNKIKSHKNYSYTILRPEMQEFLLDKLQALLDRKNIAGIFQNGVEYTMIATVLHLPKAILRMIQKFDFTRKNPKLVFLITNENTLSLEDTILAAFLNLAGFDLLFFVPTGYQCIERYFTQPFANVHQLGEYCYDLSVPDFRSVRESGFPSIKSIKRLFGRS